MSNLISRIYAWFSTRRAVISPEVQEILRNPSSAKKLMEAIKNEESNYKNGRPAVGQSGGYVVRRVGKSTD